MVFLWIHWWKIINQIPPVHPPIFQLKGVVLCSHSSETNCGAKIFQLDHFVCSSCLFLIWIQRKIWSKKLRMWSRCLRSFSLVLRGSKKNWTKWVKYTLSHPHHPKKTTLKTSKIIGKSKLLPETLLDKDSDNSDAKVSPLDALDMTSVSTLSISSKVSIPDALGESTTSISFPWESLARPAALKINLRIWKMQLQKGIKYNRTWNDWCERSALKKCWHIGSYMLVICFSNFQPTFLDSFSRQFEQLLLHLLRNDSKKILSMAAVLRHLGSGMHESL